MYAAVSRALRGPEFASGTWPHFPRQDIRRTRFSCNYPSLTLADVHAALAYFYDNRAEIEKTAAEDEQFAEEMHHKLGPGPLEQNSQLFSP